jgi:hypothetical protein
VLLTFELAQELKSGAVPPPVDGGDDGRNGDDGGGDNLRGCPSHRGLRRQSEVPSTKCALLYSKWALFYSRVVSKIALGGGLTCTWPWSRSQRAGAPKPRTTRCARACPT